MIKALLPVALGAALLLPGAADAKPKVPCQKHTEHTKVTKEKCLKLWKQRVRDRQYWPTKPVTTRDLRVRDVNIRGWIRIGRCEQPGNGRFGVRWATPSSWNWQGGTGMYWGTHQSVNHPYGRNIGSESWQVQMLVAKRVKEKYGLTAWDSFKNRGMVCWA